MKKLFVLLAAPVLALGLTGSALAADEELPNTGRVLFVAGGDIAVGADEQADAVIVIDGDADIAGNVNSLVVVDGTATVAGATVEGIAIVNGTLELESGTTVLGDVGQLNSEVVQAEGVEIGGSACSLASRPLRSGSERGSRRSSSACCWRAWLLGRRDRPRR